MSKVTNVGNQTIEFTVKLEQLEVDLKETKLNLQETEFKLEEAISKINKLEEAVHLLTQEKSHKNNLRPSAMSS